MLVYKEKVKFFKYLNAGLDYFDSPHTGGVDFIREWQYSQKRFISDEFYTLFIDLTLDEETIFSHFEKNTRYEINRARDRDNVETKFLDAKSHKNDFFIFYNEFAKQKNLASIGEAEIELLIENNIFDISAAFLNGLPLVYHTYVRANGRARLMQSASVFRGFDDPALKNVTGRANRYLHWFDMRHYKKAGFKIYDFGGINPDKTNQETMAINKFKECFGGYQVKEYKSYVPVTAKGFFFLLYKKLFGKI